MPPNHLETRMDTGFAAVPDAPKSASSRQSRRGLSDAAIRAAKPSEKAYKLPAGGSLYLEVSPSGAKLWRWKYRLLLIRHGLLQSPDAVQLEPVEGLRHLSPSKVYE